MAIAAQSVDEAIEERIDFQPFLHALDPLGHPDDFHGYSRQFPRHLEKARFRYRRGLVRWAQAASIGGILLGARYLVWRLTTLEGTGWVGPVVAVAEVVGYLFFVLSSYLFWDIRDRGRVPASASGTLDVLIPVCGEPIKIIERTLQTVLEIRYPHNTYLLNDGRIAGAANWMEVEELAEQYGVRCFTRNVGCRRKAGNLNNALKLTSGDFVAVIDSDHSVDPALGHDLLGYFSDSQVAFVTTPQHFKTAPNDIFGNLEIYFYSHIQRAKDAANSAFSTGNGVVYRRAALESIGGFSEWNIVEDLHSSYQMHSRGWRSVYHPRAMTSGLCPHSGGEVVRQRLGWATDTLRLLFWDNPITKRGLSFKQRLNYLQVGAFYVVMVLQTALLVAPALVLLWDVPILRPESVSAYLVHALPFFLLQFAVVAIPAGFHGGLRATQKCMYLAPTFLIALVGAATGIHFRSPVTDKAETRQRLWILTPQWLLFCLLVAGLVQAILEPSLANGIAALWACWIASALAIPLFTIGGGKGSRWVRPLVRLGLSGAAITAFAMAVI